MNEKFKLYSISTMAFRASEIREREIEKLGNFSSCCCCYCSIASRTTSNSCPIGVRGDGEALLRELSSHDDPVVDRFTAECSACGWSFNKVQGLFFCICIARISSFLLFLSHLGLRGHRIRFRFVKSLTRGARYSSRAVPVATTACRTKAFSGCR